MRAGLILLVHDNFARAAQVVRFWTRAGCPVVVHVDRKAPRAEVRAFQSDLSGEALVRFSRRFTCEWGGWGIVAATLAASEQMLAEFQDTSHVYLASGSCLPLRPVSELIAYLNARPDTDFIESATTSEVPWPVGGLDQERFTMWFPFSWRRQRWLFDRAVNLQRRIRLKRRLPSGLVPHMGSQWWCLTRETLAAILSDPDRPVHDRFFRHVWIPDESYFQTLARLYARRIESRSLTLSKFDFQGKPHIFYDDHLQMLRRSDCFVARKIWPRAERLYDAFLGGDDAAGLRSDPAPGRIDRVFARAVDRRTRGRAGLYMHSRYPNEDWENGITSHPYSVFEGFTELFEDFEPWLARMTGAQVHGHLFAPDRAWFAEGATLMPGCLNDSAARRDHSPRDFLTSLIWNTRGTRQCFQFGPADTQDVSWTMAKDPNAQISVISGAWAVPLFRSGADFAELRREAARLQAIEMLHLKIMRSVFIRARIRIWTMADFVEAPGDPLQTIIDEIGTVSGRRLTELPRLVDLTGFGQFLQDLKNEGMHPHLMGDFPIEPPKRRDVSTTRKSAAVR